MTVDNSLTVIVVGDPNRGMASAWSSGWLSRVNPAVVPPIVLRRGTGPWDTKVDEWKFRARFGRLPLEGEMGCAAAHVSAYRAFLTTSSPWALILEDDAIVTDSERLGDIAYEAISATHGHGHVISLFSEGPLYPESNGGVRESWLVRIRLAPMGAVAYLIDRRAAAAFVAAQTTIASIADWPPTKERVCFTYLPNDVIHHSSSNESAVASSFDRSRAVPVSVRVLMWSGIWYVMNRRYFHGPRDYFDQVVLPRLARRLWRRAWGPRAM